VSELGLFVAGVDIHGGGRRGLHRGSTPNPRPSRSYFQLNLLLLQEFERLINEDGGAGYQYQPIYSQSYFLKGRTN
jgi:hypothetical protein